MKYLVLFLLLFYTIIIYGTDYNKIDDQSKSVPSNLKTASEIGHFLTKNLTTSTDKTRAIYYWISHNIRYDLDQMNSDKVYNNTQEILDEVLLNRRGVCQHYAELFNACCQYAGVQSYVISGYTGQNGKIDKISHAWNAVNINGKFYEIDVTWAAGHLENGKYKYEFDDQYFLISPSEFIKTHIPFDPIWQFSNNPISHKEFENADFSKLKIPSNYNFNDSIKVISRLNYLDKTLRENRRISQNGISNSLIRNKVANNQQIISNEKYNLSVEIFNKAIVEFNNYVSLKNKQFQSTSLSDEHIYGILSAANQYIESSEEILRFLNSDSKELNRVIHDLENNIEKLKTNLEKEEVFLKKYIKTAKPLRIFLFSNQ